MKTTLLKVLNAVSEEQTSVKDLAKAINLGYRMTANAVAELLQLGYLAKSDGKLGLASTALAATFRTVSKRYDMAKLLGESREKVLLALLDATAIQDIQSTTRQSYRTTRRALNVLLETGAVIEKENKYAIVDDQELRFFLRTLRAQQQARLVEPYAQVVYASPYAILKRVPSGKSAKGSLTGFSAFGKYGMDLRPVWQYFVQPERELSIEDVLVHAMVFSSSPVERTDCAVFYAKNRDTMSLGRIRETARKFRVEDLIEDLENYVRNLTVASPEEFLPWDEFAEKARLYSVSPETLVPPTAFPDLFEELGVHVRERPSIYVFGGEAMRIRGLKRATKDIDMVVDDEKAFSALTEALTALGYKLLAGEITGRDVKLKASAILVKDKYPRVDIFVRTICGAFYLSDSMKKRCEERRIGNLGLRIMSNEDVFLLKSVTDREGDIYDMIELAKSPGFNWRVVFEELLVQEEKTGRHFCLALLDSAEVIERKTNVRSPFYNKLVNHCIDQAIIESVEKWKARTLKQIREFVDYPDYRLRSRIKKLVREGRLSRLKDGSFKPVDDPFELAPKSSRLS